MGWDGEFEPGVLFDRPTKAISPNYHRKKETLPGGSVGKPVMLGRTSLQTWGGERRSVFGSSPLKQELLSWKREHAG